MHNSATVQQLELSPPCQAGEVPRWASPSFKSSMRVRSTRGAHYEMASAGPAAPYIDEQL